MSLLFSFWLKNRYKTLPSLLVGGISYQGKTVIYAYKRFGTSKEKESLWLQNAEQMADKFLPYFHIEVYHYVPAEKNVNKTFERI
jgi:hypothetical protein